MPGSVVASRQAIAQVSSVLPLSAMVIRQSSGNDSLR
jgi:hypothetical protein